MNKKTKLFHWDLPHPILVSSGPFSTSPKSILNAIDHGSAAVVTKTISTEKFSHQGKVIHYTDDVLFNCDGFSTIPASQWINNWEIIKGIPVIANIHAATSEELADLAVNMVDAGAEVLELGLSCPTASEEPICFNLKKLNKFCLSVRKAVSVPVIVKIIVNMSKYSNCETVRCLEDAGMDGVTLTDSLPAYLGRKGGITGPFLKPIVMKTLHDIEKSSLCKIAVGGAFSKQDIRDYIQCGATAVGLCTMILENGWSGFESIVKEICEDDLI